MGDWTKACNTSHGFNFNADDKKTIGFVTEFVVGDSSFGPDFKVVNPTKKAKPPKAAAVGEESAAEEKGMASQQVVGVLESVAWPGMAATGQLDFAMLISPRNGQLVKALKMVALPKFVVSMAFWVLDYDVVHQCYYPSFMSHTGVKPIGGKPGAVAGGFGANTQLKNIYGLLAREDGVPKLEMEDELVEDAPGFPAYKLSFSLLPPTASEEQLLQVQTSAVAKVIKRFGVSQK